MIESFILHWDYFSINTIYTEYYMSFTFYNHSSSCFIGCLVWGWEAVRFCTPKGFPGWVFSGEHLYRGAWRPAVSLWLSSSPYPMLCWVLSCERRTCVFCLKDKKCEQLYIRFFFYEKKKLLTLLFVLVWFFLTSFGFPWMKTWFSVWRWISLY